MAGEVRKTFADMWRSLALVLVVVLGALLIGGHDLLWPSKSNHVQRISYAEAVTQAARSVGQPVLAPAGLPAAWKPTSQSLAGAGTTRSPLHLHIGFVTPDDQYAALEETVPAGALAAPRARRVVIAGRTWTVGRGAHPRELALTLHAGGTVVEVTGSAGMTELQTLAASLRQASG